MLESATQGGYMFYNSFGGVAGMYAAVEDRVRDERNRQRARDEDGGALERGAAWTVAVLRRGEGRARRS